MDAIISQVNSTLIKNIISIRNNNDDLLSLFFETKSAFESAIKTLKAFNIKFNILESFSGITLPLGTAITVTA